MEPIIEDLTIEALAFGGQGLGRHQGKVIFVPFTAPGDRISCRLLRSKKHYSEGQLLNIHTPGPQRREPPCPVFGNCGGCQWQHLEYAAQCRWKEQIFADLLTRQLPICRSRIRPLSAPAEPWGYRSRAQIKCHLTAQGLAMGFYRPGSHFVVAMEECPVLHPALNAAKSVIAGWLAGRPWARQIPQVDISVGDDGRVRAVLHYLGADRDRLSHFLAPLARQAGTALFLQSGRKSNLARIWGEEELSIAVGEPPLLLGYGPGGFAQINLEQNRAMVKEVMAAVAEDPAGRVLDLFCGMGNFTLPLARIAGTVIGVEDYAPAIDWARRNATRAGMTHIEFHARPAAGAATELSAGGNFDLVLLDPPRTGAREVIKELLRLAPRRILYISCDPATLARDLTPLIHGGYELLWSRPYDLFPQTHHIESITLLQQQKPMPV